MISLAGTLYVQEHEPVREGEEYQGEIIFENGKNNYNLDIDENCPIKLGFRGVDYNLRVNYEIFLFEVLS